MRVRGIEFLAQPSKANRPLFSLVVSKVWSIGQDAQKGSPDNFQVLLAVGLRKEAGSPIQAFSRPPSCPVGIPELCHNRNPGK